jgi:N-dimethylarginine dimethylaminohydrolase
MLTYVKSVVYNLFIDSLTVAGSISMKINVESETGLLLDVVLGSVSNFKLHSPINKTQKFFYQSAPPIIDRLIKQQDAFVEVLNKYGVNIYWIEPQPNSPNQLNVRDIAVVVRNTLIICAMKEPIRLNEPDAFQSLIPLIETPIKKVGEGVLEGGDIILDRETIYLGISERTNPIGLDWLSANFSDSHTIVPIQLKEGFLHLDVVFNLIGKKTALIYPPAIQVESLRVLESRYELMPVDWDEQFNLACNVFSLSPETLISDKRHIRMNDLITKAGYEVIKLDFSEITKIGGSFRCGTCPLARESINNL